MERERERGARIVPGTEGGMDLLLLFLLLLVLHVVQLLWVRERAKTKSVLRVRLELLLRLCLRLIFQSPTKVASPFKKNQFRFKNDESGSWFCCRSLFLNEKHKRGRRPTPEWDEANFYFRIEISSSSKMNRRRKGMKLDQALKLYIALYCVAFMLTWLISVPMLIHVTPQSECLLFVTPYVKYGSPASKSQRSPGEFLFSSFRYKQGFVCRIVALPVLKCIIFIITAAQSIV